MLKEWEFILKATHIKSILHIEPKASNFSKFKFTIRSDTHYAISCLIIIFCPKKKEKFNKKWGYQFFLIYKHQGIFLFFGNKYLKNLCRKKLETNHDTKPFQS
jgi:hypothetical protein